MLKRVVLVTGGASGLGKSVVERVIKQGYNAAIWDLPTSQGASLANQFGNDTVFCPTDVTSESDVENSLNILKDKFGRLDVIVNCAGIQNPFRTYNFKYKSPCKLSKFSRIIEINTIGTFNVIRVGVGLIAENEPNNDGFRGLIINTASTVAFEALSGNASYAASKGAVVSMTLPLAREFAPQGIRVCAISPGLFNTPLTQSFSAESNAQYQKQIPYPNRYGKPDEFALLVETIILNPYLNGENIRLDGATRL